MRRTEQRHFSRSFPPAAVVVLCAAVAWGVLPSAPLRAVEVKPLARERRINSPGSVEWTFDLSELPAGRQVRLGLDARVDWPAFAGSNPFMVVTINGETVLLPDLLNKDPEFTTRDGTDARWAQGSQWRVVYGPDFSNRLRTLPGPQAIPDADPYRFVWDVTRHVKKGSNRVSVNHPHLLAQGTTLVLRDVAVEVGAPLKPRAAEAVAPTPAGPVPIYVARGARPVDLEARLAADGGVVVRVNGLPGAREFRFTTRTSLPNGKWLSTAGAKGEGRRLGRGETATAGWAGGGYRVERRVSVRRDHIHVADTFTNTSDHLVGVLYQNWLALPEKPAEVLLGGRPRYADTQASERPAHPTALARWPDVAVGLAAEDDVFRVHSRAFAEPGAIGLADQQLGLGPGGSHTLEWSIYPLPGGGYWEFVNAVRRNWGSNYLLPALPAFDHLGTSGPWRDAAGHCRWARARGAEWLVSSQTIYAPGEYDPHAIAGFEKMRPGDAALAEGTAIPLGRAWVARARTWAEALHRCDGRKALLYLHTQICTEPHHDRLYAADRMLDAAGAPVLSPYSYPVYQYLPTLDNRYGRALRKAVREALEATGADGVFNDEMDWATTPYAYQPELWDGCTAVIDPASHAVTGKRSSVALLQQPWKVALVRDLHAKGKVVLGNGEPSTRTLLGLKVPRFVETASYSFLIDTHLASPLGLGTHDPEETEPVRTRMVRRFLDRGALLVPYSWSDDPRGPHYLPLMYPTTPEELWPGVVLGRERIITNRSGRFGWPGGEAARVYVFDGAGRPVTAPQVREVRADGRRLTEVRMPSDHFAVLVREAATRR